MAAANIKMTPEQVKSIGKIYHTSSSDIKEMLDKLSSAQTQLATQWEGDAFAAFGEQFDKLKPKVNDFSILLEDIYKQINSIAKIVEETDNKISQEIKKGFK